MTTLAIDLGGTNMRAGVVDAQGMPDHVEQSGAPRSREEFLNHVGALLERYSADRLGIGVPGLAAGTVTTWIPNLGFLDGLDLAEVFPGISISVGNDAQLSLLAEAS